MLTGLLRRLRRQCRARMAPHGAAAVLLLSRSTPSDVKVVDELAPGLLDAICRGRYQNGECPCLHRLCQELLEP